jgi:hypothetical protein
MASLASSLTAAEDDDAHLNALLIAFSEQDPHALARCTATLLSLEQRTACARCRTVDELLLLPPFATNATAPGAEDTAATTTTNTTTTTTSASSEQAVLELRYSMWSTAAAWRTHTCVCAYTSISAPANPQNWHDKLPLPEPQNRRDSVLLSEETACDQVCLAAQNWNSLSTTMQNAFIAFFTGGAARQHGVIEVLIAACLLTR